LLSAKPPRPLCRRSELVHDWKARLGCDAGIGWGHPLSGTKDWMGPPTLRYQGNVDGPFRPKEMWMAPFVPAITPVGRAHSHLRVLNTLAALVGAAVVIAGIVAVIWFLFSLARSVDSAAYKNKSKPKS